MTEPASAAAAETNGHGLGVVAARDLARRYGEGDTAVDALRGVSLDVERGKLTAVMGPSGSGKSTLMHLLAGLDRPTGGRGLDRRHRHHRARRHRPDEAPAPPHRVHLPVLQPAADADAPRRTCSCRSRSRARSRTRRGSRSCSARSGSTDRRTHRPSELSGGQQQRVAIARALISRPTVVFADEPTGNLDSTTSGEILDLLRDAVDHFGQTTVMVTHDARAAAMADRVLFLADGRIVQGAPALRPARDPRRDGAARRRHDHGSRSEACSAASSAPR